MKFPATSQAKAQAVFTALNNSPNVVTAEESKTIYLDPIERTIVEMEETNIFQVPFEIQASEPSPATTWGLDRINQCALPLDNQMNKQDATGVTVFIMDTGVRGDHEEFAGVIDPNDACHKSFVDDEPNPLEDLDGHG